jgi:hypothetical protein
MKKRHLYVLLFAVPGASGALLVSGLVGGALAGAAWLFAFGDDPWPAWFGVAFPLLLAAVFLSVWAGVLVGAYRVGRRLEGRSGIERRQVLCALLATGVPLGVIVLHQFSVGNLGPPFDGERCARYCSGNGYAAGSLSPHDSGDRTCSCLGPRGEAEITLPMDRIPLRDR